jgi:predicted ATP-dependent endonuclease of OLD family
MELLIRIFISVVAIGAVYVPTTLWLEKRQEKKLKTLKLLLERHTQETAKLRQAYEKMKDAEKKKAWNIEYLKDEIQALAEKKVEAVTKEQLEELRKQPAILLNKEGGTGK